jgi:pimeloyl-ACP methyl ester carboxylesterase
MARVDESLKAELADVPTLTIFGERNDPFGWQGRYEKTFKRTKSVVIEKGNHFPSMDDPDKFAASIRRWWAEAVGA